MAPPRLRIDAITAARLTSDDNLPGVFLTAPAAAILRVYQDLVHQNPSIHLFGRIYKDSKWQARRKNFFVLPPNATVYFLAGLRCFFV